MSLIVERRHSWLDLRSVVVAVVVLLVGAGIGFGVGYEVKAHRTTTTAKTAAAAKKAPVTGAQAQASTAGIASFRSCLASHGVTYPAIAGGEKAFAAQIAKPPAGVAKSTYDTALRTCYAASTRAKP
jgi:hypothetical protein